MDVRLAGDKARFGFPFANLGVVPEAASTWFLPRIVGISLALEWCLSGRLVGAEEALSAGLVRSVHTPEDLLPAALLLAHSLVDHCAPVSAALTRQMLWRLSAAEHPMLAHRVESRILAERQRSRDMQEGIASFLGKRPPEFLDRVSADLPKSFPWWTEPLFPSE
jgi:enoyl-CoA hydratase/carnithine racemase